MKNSNEKQIIEITDLLNALYSQQLDLKTQLKGIEKQIAEAEYLAQEVLKQENKEQITCGYWTFGWDVKQRTAFDQTLFKTEHPDIYDKYKTTKEIRTFKFGHKE